MSEPDLRQDAQKTRDALERFSKEELIEILVHVFRQYVVEGSLGTSLPPSTALSAEELSGHSFPHLIERLQMRLDLPELALFEVKEGRVFVRVEGRQVPLDGSQGTQAASGQGQSQGRISAVQVALRPQPAPPAPPAVSVTEVSRQTAPTPAAPPSAQAALAAQAEGAAAARVQTQAPGVIPAGHAAARQAPAQAAPTTPAAPPPKAAQPREAQAKPAAQQQAPQKEDRGDGGRFTLLEID